MNKLRLSVVCMLFTLIAVSEAFSGRVWLDYGRLVPFSVTTTESALLTELSYSNYEYGWSPKDERVLIIDPRDGRIPFMGVTVDRLKVAFVDGRAGLWHATVDTMVVNMILRLLPEPEFKFHTRRDSTNHWVYENCVVMYADDKRLIGLATNMNMTKFLLLRKGNE